MSGSMRRSQTIDDDDTGVNNKIAPLSAAAAAHALKLFNDRIGPGACASSDDDDDVRLIRGARSIILSALRWPLKEQHYKGAAAHSGSIDHDRCAEQYVAYAG